MKRCDWCGEALCYSEKTEQTFCLVCEKVYPLDPREGIPIKLAQPLTETKFTVRGVAKVFNIPPRLLDSIAENDRQQRRERALELLNLERELQRQKWGDPKHDDTVWLTVLMEEVGEVARAVLDLRSGNGPIERIREELIQVGAVAVAHLEHIMERMP